MKKPLLLSAFLSLAFLPLFSQNCATLDVNQHQVTCKSATKISLNAVYTNATGVTWTIVSASGTLSGTTYTLSPQDTTNGYIEFQVSTTGGTCKDTATKVYFTFEDSTYSSLASQINLCGQDSTSLTLGQEFNSVTWSSSGPGTFVDYTKIIGYAGEAYYYPTQAEISSGQTTISYTAVGGCKTITDSTVITYGPPNPFSQDTFMYCGTKDTIVFTGVDDTNYNYTWSSTNAGSFSGLYSSNTSLYLNQGIADTSFTLTLSISSTSCSTYVYPVVRLGKPDTYISGSIDTLCNTPPSIYLSNYDVNNADSYQWKTSGDGYFGFYYYYLGKQDSINKKVTLSVTATNACGTSSDSTHFVMPYNLSIDVTPAVICAQAGSLIKVTGMATGVSNTQWSVVPASDTIPQTLSFTHTVSSADSSYQYIYYTLSANAGSCGTIYAYKNITVSSGQLYLDNDSLKLCQRDSVLAGAYTDYMGNSSFKWTTMGSGTFFPADTGDYVYYYPSVADSANGSVNLVVSTYNPACGNTLTDTMKITFLAAQGGVIASINPPEVTSLCSNQTLQLSGITDNNYALWTTTGKGHIAYANTLNISYNFAPTDSGVIKFYLTPTHTGQCNAIKDSVNITVMAAPQVKMGINQLPLIASGVKITSDTIIGSYSSLYWSSDGTGSFDDYTLLHPTYTPSAEDMSRTDIALTLQVYNAQQCFVNDTLTLKTSGTCNATININQTNKNEITFSALNITNNPLGSYIWDFGDGNQASGIDQYHTYADSGYFYVSLNFWSADSTCHASDYYYLQIGDTLNPTYFIDGTVMAGLSPLDEGIISLFRQDGGYYTFYGRVSIDPLSGGKFTFSNLSSGDYLLLTGISPQSRYKYIYVPTYLGDTVDWSNQIVVHLNQNEPNKVIQLKPITKNLSWIGTVNVNGNLVFGAINPRLTAGSASEPVDGAVVTLYNNSGNRLTSTYTDPFGNYSFDSLGAGTYTAGVQYPGADSTGIPITISGNEGSKTLGSTTVNQVNVTGIIAARNQAQTLIIFPNPVSDILSVNLPASASNAQYRIMNMMGINVSTGQTDAGGLFRFDGNQLESGMYILEIMSNNAVFRGKFRKL